MLQICWCWCGFRVLLSVKKWWKNVLKKQDAFEFNKSWFYFQVQYQCCIRLGVEGLLSIRLNSASEQLSSFVTCIHNFFPLAVISIHSARQTGKQWMCWEEEYGVVKKHLYAIKKTIIAFCSRLNVNTVGWYYLI